ncbi:MULTISPECIES: hypothetical protein [unclassified Streptomyces]|uniref:hypothetical protein n=1 Tax=unclassified Streptomyces TaxID=2593676 RepID=UPI00378EA100
MTFDVRPIAALDLAAANMIGEEKQWELVAAPNDAVRLAGDDRDPVFAYLCTEGATVLGWVYGAYRLAWAKYLAYQLAEARGWGRGIRFAVNRGLAIVLTEPAEPTDFPT